MGRIRILFMIQEIELHSDVAWVRVGGGSKFENPPRAPKWVSEICYYIIYYPIIFCHDVEY